MARAIRPAILLLALAGLTSGCGKESADRFNAKFDENFRSSCIGAALKQNVPQAVATQVCECAITGINAKYDARQKLTMTDDQAKPIMAECLNKTVQR